MHHLARSLLLSGTALALVVGDGAAQDVDRASARLVREVMPEADRFDPADGDPPVKRAYRDDRLIGYVFLTSDLPPQAQGYSGPIEVLVGVDTAGVLTGVRVTAYRESYRYERGDFLSDPAFLAQFTGKMASDRFTQRQDIDGISGVTISVRAMARGIRDAARRVALAYVPPPEPLPGGLSEADLVTMSWYEIQRRGAAESMVVRQRRRNPYVVSLIHASSEPLARYLTGSRYESLAESIEEAGGADEVVLYVVGGDTFVPALRTGWSVEQGGRTVELPRERVVTIGRPAGALSGESSQLGALLIDADEVDLSAPLTFAFDRGRPELGTFRVDYTSWTVFAHMANAAANAEAEAEVATTPAPPSSPEAVAGGPADAAVAVADAERGDADPTDAEPEREDVTPDAPSEDVDSAEPPTTATPVDPTPGPASQGAPVEVLEEELLDADSSFGTSGFRVGWMLLVIALASLAFFTKRAALRWVSLAVTAVVLGWIDGGFLSISHVTGLIWVGTNAVRSDPSLLILSLFTVTTVLLWGRVFCGYLCPFGALQDFIDRFVPRRFKRELPPGAHRVAFKAKYGILAVILGAAVVGVPVSLYQYFEPFGTVFFLSPNPLLWAIACAILVASAVVPRFYCRYACPLGALLAVGSLISLRRIGRVEQCDHCHVCEQRCPTRAIRGPAIEFAECVRCNVCEIQLIERMGVCRHRMEDIRPRLVQLQRRTPTAQS